MEKLSRHIFRRRLHPEFQWFNPFVTAPVLGKYAHSFYTIYPAGAINYRIYSNKLPNSN